MFAPEIRSAPLVAVVEDEADLCDMLCHHLDRAGYRTWTATDGKTALERVAQDPPDLVLLDLMLPGVSGTAVLAELRRERATRHIPVIVLTARSKEPDELIGFALGADDYITKPFSFEILLARVRAVFRRATPQTRPSSAIVAGPLALIPERNEVTVDDEPVVLTRTEFQLLREILVTHGRVVRRDRLIELVFGSAGAMDRRIDVHMTNLRRKLGRGGDWVQTIRGIGYAVRDPVHLPPEHFEPVRK